MGEETFYHLRGQTVTLTTKADVEEGYPGDSDVAIERGSDVPLNSIVQLASMICGTPMSTVTVLDGAKQKHKAKVGVDGWETPREHAFCVYTIEGNEMFIVPDARLDERFKDNPLVTGPPNIRFYAGVPIRSPEGRAIATLCVLDRVPRTLSGDQSGALEMLSLQVASRFESLRLAQGGVPLHLEDRRIRKPRSGEK